MTQRDGRFIQSLDRGLELLETLAAERREMSLGELASRFEWDKSTTHRLLATLSRRGHVEQDPETSKYRVGLSVLRLSSGLDSRLELRRRAAPYIERLALDSRETSHLAVQDGLEVIVLEQTESPEKVRAITHVGTHLPAHCSALGKVLLAGMPAPQFDAWLQTVKTLERYTDDTITDPAALRDHLAQIAVQGYAYDDREHDSGMRCLAGPVFDGDGGVVAAAGISGPANRISARNRGRLIELVRETAHRISLLLLGHQPS